MQTLLKYLEWNKDFNIKSSRERELLNQAIKLVQEIENQRIGEQRLRDKCSNCTNYEGGQFEDKGLCHLYNFNVRNGNHCDYYEVDEIE